MPRTPPLVGNRSMVGQRSLTPSILVRVQVPQPIESPQHQCVAGFVVGLSQRIVSRRCEGSHWVRVAHPPVGRMMGQDSLKIEMPRNQNTVLLFPKTPLNTVLLFPKNRSIVFFSFNINVLELRDTLSIRFYKNTVSGLWGRRLQLDPIRRGRRGEPRASVIR